MSLVTGRPKRARAVTPRTYTRLVRVRSLLATVAAGALAASAVPAGAQTAQAAPAIGPWLGAPRGAIVETTALDGAIEVRAELRDPDSARSIRYVITVDGRAVVRGQSGRPSDFGQRVQTVDAVTAGPGLHNVCLRVGDERFGDRTVDCVRSTTSPPDTTTPELQDQASGVLVSPTGVVMPVVGGRAGNWRVTTPCGATTRIGEGTFVEGARVVVDPGHGGSESGAWGPGILEKDLNLTVSELVVERLESLGISAQLTRTSDYRLPIRTRAEIATALAPDVFISVHHNGGATRPSSRPGTEVFYGVEKDESRRLAAIMYEEMVEALSPYDVAWVSTVSEGASLRLRDDGMDLYGIHRYSPDVNSVISEFLYLSNPPEARLMQQPGLVELEADTIVASLLRWWWTDDDGTTRGRQFTDSSSSGTGGFDGCVDPTLTLPEALFADPAGVESDSDEADSGFLLVPALFLRADPAL